MTFLTDYSDFAFLLLTLCLTVSSVYVFRLRQKVFKLEIAAVHQAKHERSLQRHVDRLSKHLDASEAVQNSLQNTVDSQKNIRSRSSELFKKQLAHQKSVLKAEQTKNADLTTKIHSLENRIEALQQQIADWEKCCRAKDDELTTQKTINKTLRKDKTGLYTELEVLKNELSRQRTLTTRHYRRQAAAKKLFSLLADQNLRLNGKKLTLEMIEAHFAEILNELKRQGE